MQKEDRPSPSRQAAVAPTRPKAGQVRLSWLLGALGLLVLAALGCAYFSLCLLFVQGQWQLLYRPSPAIAATPASLGLSFQQVRYGTTEAGVSELTAWVLPAQMQAPPTQTQALLAVTQAQARALAPSIAGMTILYLHDARGSLGDTLPALAHLHSFGCAVFAIDYRGFGASAAGHPSEARMVEDAVTSLRYLTGTLHLAPASLVVWGQGMGATIGLEALHSPGSVSEGASSEDLPATQGKRTTQPDTAIRLVLEDVSQPALSLVQSDPRTRWLPVRLLLQDRLDAAAALNGSHEPRLFLHTSSQATETERLYTLSSAPKEYESAADADAVRRFLSKNP